MRNREKIENELIPNTGNLYNKGVDRYANDIRGLKKLISLSLEVLLDIRDLLGLGEKK